MDPRIVSSRGTDAGAIPVTLEVNSAAVSLPVAPYVTLLDLLRERLQLTGTKKGCDHGQCGACTVLVDGMPINSCLKLAVTADGARVTTIEGLAADGRLAPLQRSFIEHDAFRCGYCTPGQICSATALGVKGGGEIGVIGTATAVVNAIHHATGKRVRSLPVRVDKLLG